MFSHDILGVLHMGDELAASVSSWQKYYGSLKDAYLFPNEFVVRSLLGNYPGLKVERSYKGARICDISCGDGRNMTAMAPLGLEIYGTEITEEICAITKRKLESHNISADIRQGFNWSLPFEDCFFDYALSWNACYYMRDKDSSIADHIDEYARVMKSGALLIACVPTPKCFSLKGATELGNNLIRINTDSHWNMLNGTIYHRFDAVDAIEEQFGRHFHKFNHARISDDCYGLPLEYFVFVCQKR